MSEVNDIPTWAIVMARLYVDSTGTRDDDQIRRLARRYADLFMEATSKGRAEEALRNFDGAKGAGREVKLLVDRAQLIEALALLVSSTCTTPDASKTSTRQLLTSGGDAAKSVALRVLAHFGRAELIGWSDGAFVTATWIGGEP